MAMTFPAGEPVEVRSADGAAWIEARVVRAFLLSRRYVVAYDNGTFNETFPAGRVRPRPSPSPAGAGAGAQFRRYQIVEVFSDGWWRAGVVFKVHAASEEWRYDVCFPEKREEWEFGSAEVRAKLDWVDGEWVPAEGKVIQLEINKTIKLYVNHQVKAFLPLIPRHELDEAQILKASRH